MDLSEFPWAIVASILLGNGLVTYLVNWRREANRERKMQERDARYLALRLAVLFEKYALEAANMMANNEIHETSGGHAGSPRAYLNEMYPYPEDADWKALDPALASRALSFPTEVQSSNSHLRAAAEFHTDPSDSYADATDEASRQGYRAWEIAVALRKAYRLPRSHLVEPSDGWLVALRNRYNLVEAQEEARRQSR